VAKATAEAIGNDERIGRKEKMGSIMGLADVALIPSLKYVEYVLLD